MANEETYNKLTELTEGLVYISESESEFSVYEVEPNEVKDINSFMEDIVGQSAVTFKEENYTIFFEKLLGELDTEDEVMQQLSQRYMELFSYLQANFKNIRVVTAGDVEHHIFIICSSETSDSFLLHTIAIES